MEKLPKIPIGALIWQIHEDLNSGDAVELSKLLQKVPMKDLIEYFEKAQKRKEETNGKA
jgi:hypothetical protein